MKGDEPCRKTQPETPNLQMDQILESISDGFFTLSPDWRYTYLNSNAAKMVGKTVEELLGKCIWEEFPEAVNSPFYNRRAICRQLLPLARLR